MVFCFIYPMACYFFWSCFCGGDCGGFCDGAEAGVGFDAGVGGLNALLTGDEAVGGPTCLPGCPCPCSPPGRIACGPACLRATSARCALKCSRSPTGRLSSNFACSTRP